MKFQDCSYNIYLLNNSVVNNFSNELVNNENKCTAYI